MSSGPDKKLMTKDDILVDFNIKRNNRTQHLARNRNAASNSAVMPGIDPSEYDQYGYDRDGLDREGYDKDGFDRHGIHRDEKNMYEEY